MTRRGRIGDDPAVVANRGLGMKDYRRRDVAGAALSGVAGYVDAIGFLLKAGDFVRS